MKFAELPPEVQLQLGGNIRKVYSSIHLDQQGIVSDLIKNPEKYTDRYEIDSDSLHEGENYQLWNIEAVKLPRREDSEPKEGRFFVLLDKNDKLVYTFSERNKDFLNDVVVNFFNQVYPQIFRVNFASNEIRDALDYLGDYLDHTFTVKRASRKRLFGESPETVLSFKKGELPTATEVFKQSEQEDLWVDYIKVKSDSEPIHTVSMTRKGSIMFETGELPSIIEFLAYLGEKALEKRNLLSDREIRESEGPSPLILEYDNEVFAELDNREKMIKQFSDYRKCSYSVIHNGNPHIYMYVSDSQDNSSFSLRSVGNSKLMITPQTKANAGSLMRLLNFLTQSFSEPKEIKEEIE